MPMIQLPNTPGARGAMLALTACLWAGCGQSEDSSAVGDNQASAMIASVDASSQDSVSSIEQSFKPGTKDDAESLRIIRATLEKLTQARDARAESDVREILEQCKDPTVSSLALKYVLAIDSIKSIPVVVQTARTHPHNDVRGEALATLRELTGEDFGEDWQKWSLWYRSRPIRALSVP